MKKVTGKSTKFCPARPRKLQDLFPTIFLNGRRRTVFAADLFDGSLEDEEYSPKAAEPAKELPRPPQPKPKAKPKPEPDEAEFDAILDQAVEQSKLCAKCQERLPPYALYCQICKLKFCFSHRLPEAHGCGEKAAQRAKEVNAKKTAPPPKQAPQLAKRLEKKIEEAKKSRMAKKPS
jgi:hypothetical protein